MVLIGVVTSLAIPGVQKMYGSMERSLKRKDLHAALNSLALLVQTSGSPVTFKGFPAEPGELPQAFIDRLAELDISLAAEAPIYISAAGFCPEGGKLIVTSGRTQYALSLREIDCRVVK